MYRDDDSDTLIIEQAVIARLAADKIYREILRSITPPDEEFKAIVQFRVLGLLLVNFADFQLRLLDDGSREAERQQRNLIARIDAVVRDWVQEAEQAFWARTRKI